MNEDEELAKDLGPLAAFTIGVGTMIGAGIFVLPGEAADIAGPAVALSFVVGGVISLFTALSTSELGTAMPKSGGAYYYINHSLGPLFGSIAGLGNWIGLAFASAFYMIGFGDFISDLVRLPALALGPLSLTPVQVAALIAGVVFVAVNYVGAKETGRLQNAIVVSLVAILTLFTVLGFLSMDLSTLTPFAPKGVDAIMPGTALIFVSYLGFVQIASVGEEIKNPGRNLPLAIVGSVVFVTVLYAIIMVVLMGVVDWSILAESSSPVIDVAREAFGSALGVGAAGAVLILVGGLLATGSSANASILASSRINFAMGRDGLMTSWLNEVHPRFATPYRSIAVTGAFILAFIAIGDVARLARAGSVLHLVVYGLLNVGLIVMREADTAEYDPDFRAPLYPVVPIVGALTSFGLIAFMDPVEIALGACLAIGGVLWYLFYARTRATKQGILGKYVLTREERMPDAAVSMAAAMQPDGGTYRVMVPLANPAHERDLIRVGAAIAAARDGVLEAIHVVQVPDQTPLERGPEYAEQLAPDSETLLEGARTDAADFGVEVETRTIYSHRSVEEVFDAAREHGADLVVMGWGGNGDLTPGRVEGAFDELAHDLPCDVAVLKDRGVDASRVLLPTAGGPDSTLAAAIARALRDAVGAEVTLLHVAEDRTAGEDFLDRWADEHGLPDAARRVETGDVEAAIGTAAADCTLLLMGATERGLLSRLVRGSLVLDVVDDVDCSVLLAETAHDRSLRERLFG